MAETTSSSNHQFIKMSVPLQNDAESATIQKRLPIWDLSKPHKFSIPTKEINEGHDVPNFLTSRAYSDIGTFVMQLNIAMCPRKEKENGKTEIKTFELNSNDIIVSGMVERIQSLLRRIEAITEEAPPDTGPRRFGNISFRKWYQILEERVPALMREYIPLEILNAEHSGEATAQDELTSYLLGAFGSSQRLDYGTGHELSFLAFLGSIWKLGGFAAGVEANDDGKLERSIVIGIFEP
jgi:serine/threonine-protein phosphatase 2A activator